MADLNITQLTPVTDLADDDIFYVATGVGTSDNTITRKAFREANLDVGYITDPPVSQPIGTGPGLGEPIIASTRSDANAKGFTVDETTGLFTATAAGIGVVYLINFTIAAPKGPVSNDDIHAELVKTGSAPSAILLDVRYVSNTSASWAMSGRAPFTFGAPGDTVSIRIYAGSGGSTVPFTAYVDVVNI